MVGNLNDSQHILNQIINCKNNELGLEIFFIRHYSKLDEKYKSKEITVSDDLVNWLKNNIKQEIQAIKFKNNPNEGPVFQYHDYNDELTINDSVAILDVEKKGNPIKNRLLKLKESTTNDTGVLNHTNFSLVKLTLNEEAIYTGYYKGIRKNGTKKKYALGLIESNEFYELTQPMIELGGNIAFVIHKNNIFVLNPKLFEYAFKYTDHITKMRDRNLSKIVNMPFFCDPIASSKFYEKSRDHLRARSIAQISEETLEQLENNFNDRCTELKEIKRNIDDNPEIAEEIRKDLGIILDLIDYIDLDKNQIIFSEESDPTPLLHLFQDKIMSSFLTKHVRTVLAR